MQYGPEGTTADEGRQDIHALSFSAAGSAEGEQMYVFVEPMPERAKDAASYQDLVVDVVTAVRDRLGMRPARVYLLKPRAIPMTANGKLRYPALCDAYTDGSLRADGKILPSWWKSSVRSS